MCSAFTDPCGHCCRGTRAENCCLSVDMNVVIEGLFAPSSALGEPPNDF